MSRSYSTITEASLSHRRFYLNHSRLVFASYLLALILALVGLTYLPYSPLFVVALAITICLAACYGYSRQYLCKRRRIACLGVCDAGWFFNDETNGIDIVTVRLLSAAVLTLKYRCQSRYGYLFVTADMMTDEDFHYLKLALQFNAKKMAK